MSGSQKRWVLYVDQRITRRKYYHLLATPEGETRWRTKEFTEILEVAMAEGIDEFEIVPYRSEAPRFLCKALKLERKQ